MTLGDPRAGTLYLRRLARAHVAGEVSTEDYRRQRRAFIDACSHSTPGWSDDPTVPRTPRANGGGSVAPTAVQGPDRLRGRRVWLWIMPFTVVLLVILRADLLG